MNIATQFMKAMSTLDEFSQREIFASLTTKTGSQCCELMFSDGSLAYNHWYTLDNDLVVDKGVKS